MDLVSKVKYTINELDSLMSLGVRRSMFLNTNSEMHEVALENKNSISQNGNPINNSLYKNMKIETLKTHVNIAHNTKSKLNVDEDKLSSYDICIDDGHIDYSQDLGYSNYLRRKGVRILTPYTPHSKLKLYQPYFKPTGRISDFAVAHSVGAVGMKFDRNSKGAHSIIYSDRYKDKDLNCVTVVIDVSKGCNQEITEFFENKDGLKIYKIVYLIRDYASLKLVRTQDLNENMKGKGINIIETNVIQFPNSKFEYEIIGEGNKYNQDLMYIDVYKNCTTDIKGRFDLYGDNTNNLLINIHHIGEDSTSNVDVKSVIDDFAHSSFVGNVIVDKDATNTDAKLYNKNLLLSSKATAITEPQLDIHTKEISCSHGCTVSNIDKEQLYYLESKGIETNMAEETLKQCFLQI